jgi:hypothetical protein
MQWKAVYTDGTHLDQIEESGDKNEYKDIDRDKLQAFELWDEDKRVISLRFSKGQRLIWRRRTIMSPGGIVQQFHIIGKQQTVNGKNYQGIIAVFEDGRVEVAGKFEEGHPFFQPVKIHKDEGEEWVNG